MGNQGRQLIRYSLLSLFVFLSIGCARMNSVMMHSGVDSANTIRVFTYDDELKNTYFKKGRNGLRFCREPMPDAAPTFAEGMTIGLPHSGGSNVGGSDSVGGLGLGGRNPEVLIAREFLFRACELSLNVDADYTQSRTIYSEFLKAAQTIAKMQQGTGTQASSSTIETEISSGGNAIADGSDDSDDSDTSTNDPSSSDSSSNDSDELPALANDN